jgi:DNA invertase Pin-like site-specific DNA recombinase
MKENIVYIRTSTEEQNPELQLEDCSKVINKLGITDYEIVQDKQSAWKDSIPREGFENIRQAIQRRTIKILICWDLDRLFRNRKRLIAFFEFCKIYNCKIYSYRQDWLESINNITAPFNEIVHGLMLQVMGWLAEEESSKKSMRVKNAVRKENGITESYKGNKWGRKNISEKTKELIVEAYKANKPYSTICKEVFYWDKNGNPKYVSKGLVHKIISKFKGKDVSLSESS